MHTKVADLEAALQANEDTLKVSISSLGTHMAAILYRSPNSPQRRLEQHWVMMCTEVSIAYRCGRIHCR